VKALHELEKLERFQKALPPQTEEEINILEQRLLEDGCLDPIRTWHNIIIDGHTRYDICHKKGIPFAVEELDFQDEDEAFLWIIKNQLGRRNLTPFVKCELVMPLEKIIRAEAKKRQVRKASDFVPPNLAGQNGRDSRDEIASMADVSHGNFAKAKWLHENADEDTQNALRAGRISIHKAYTNLRGTVPPRKSKQSSPSKIIRFPSATPIEPGWSEDEDPFFDDDDDPVEKQSSPSKIIKFASATPIEPDWSEGEAPFTDDEEPVEKIDPIQDFDPGPSINDITGILTEIQSNTVHFTDRFMELLSRVLPDDATEENKTAITSTIDNAYTTINNKIKEVFFHEH